MKVTGKTLISWGFEPGPWFPRAIETAKRAAAEGADEVTLIALVADQAPPKIETIPLQSGVGFHTAIEAETADERHNLEKVVESMARLMATPTLRSGAVMPDACPAGPPGTIPVGGVVAAKGAIHPGMHSADICCSVAITVMGKVSPAEVLDAGQRVTHFGGGGRREGAWIRPPAEVLAPFEENPFLTKIQDVAVAHFATQGDGNHFLYVGRLASTGETALVTHHGSRKPGAMLYKEGMAVAEAYRAKHAPEVQKQNAWIPAETAEGEAYWAALQAIRAWTKASHFTLHDMVLEAVGAKITERFWNEHNFVFRRGDDFLHGKGATPAWKDFAPDASGQVLIPLNMAEPVLIARGTDNAKALGFCPHGAGRNFSRTEHARRQTGRKASEIVAEETRGIDARFWCGVPDTGELPSAYKRADEVVRQIEAFGLAEIVDRVEPYGSIMAGDWLAGFRKKKSGNDRRKESAKR